MTSEERIRRGQEAARLLSEPLLIEAFATAERNTFEAIVDTKPEDDRGRVALQERVKAIRDVRDILKGILLSGNEAARPNPGTPA